MTMPSQRKVQVAYSLLQIGFWGMYGAFGGFQTAILLDRGFSSGAAGAFIALGFLAGILTQPLLGSWADRHLEIPLKRLFGLCMIPALAINFIFYFTRPDFLGTAAVFLLLGALETNAYPLIDSMAMQYLNAGMDVPYSLGRGLGAFAYAVVCVLVGWQTARLGIQTALITHGALLVLLLLFTALFPTFPKELLTPAASRPASHSAWHLLRSNKPFTLMLVGGFFAMAAVMPIASFLTNLIVDRGGGSGDLGLGLFLMAASELPAAVLFQKLWKKIGSHGALAISFGFMALKPLVILLTHSLTALLLVQPLQMLGYGLFSPAIVHFANENVAPEDRIQGQSLKMVLTNGLGSVVGNLVAGQIIDWGGTSAMLLTSLACGAVGTGFGVWAILARRQRVEGA